MQGREVDMEKLMRQNELMPAIGNVRVNARGDELGPGGKIIKKREDVLAEYYENNPKAVPESVKAKSQQVPPTVVGHGTNSRKTKSNEEE
jgi:ribosomal protein S17E